MSNRKSLLVTVSLLGILIVAAACVIVAMALLLGFGRHKKKRVMPEEELVLRRMQYGVTRLKRDLDLDPLEPLGAWTGGRVSKGGSALADPARDFVALGVKAGDRLVTLPACGAPGRTISAVTGNKLTLSGTPFNADHAKLSYFVVKPAGGSLPRLEIAKELAPDHPAWKATCTPVRNARRKDYFEPDPSSVTKGAHVDPWGTPYLYRLELGKGVIIEKLVCAGKDGKYDTPDDVVIDLAEIPR
jgi:hypothetical protein